MPVDMDEYLPKDTLNWCQSKLVELGYERGEISSTEFNLAVQLRRHEQAYRELRRQVHHYLATGAKLSETSPPYGGVAWEPQVSSVTNDAYNGRLADPHAPQQMDFPNDGIDEKAEEGDFDETA
jgi:hypothetical protein